MKMSATNSSFAVSGFESSANNSATEGGQWILDVTQKLSFSATVTVMFGLGCSTSTTRILNFIKTPKKFFTGISLQLLLLPLLGFCISQVMRFNLTTALGMIIQSASPGGTYSNIATYWLDGNMDLSIVMTTVSTLLALGFMPMWLYAFSAILQLDETLRVPYKWLGIGLAGMVVPILIGIAVQHFLPSKARILTKVFSITGSIMMAGLLFLIIIEGMLNQTDAKLAGSAFLFLFCAFAIGYAATRIPFLGFSQPERRTIGIEIMFQNAPVAFNVIFLSYKNSPPNVVVSIIVYSLFYGTVQCFLAAVVVVVYLLMKKYGYNNFVPIKEVENEEDGGNDEYGVASVLTGKKTGTKLQTQD